MARSETRSNWLAGAGTALDAALYRLSIYGVPVLLALLSVAALVLWEPEYTDSTARALPFQMTEARGAPLTPQRAAQQLAGAPALRHHDTRLSEAPFWLRFDLQAAPAGNPPALEFPGSAKATIFEPGGAPR